MHKIIAAVDPICSYLVTRFVIRPFAALRAFAAKSAAAGSSSGLVAFGELRVIDHITLMVGIRYVLQLVVWGMMQNAMRVFAWFVLEQRHNAREIGRLAQARRLAGRVAIIDLPTSAAREVTA